MSHQATLEARKLVSAASTLGIRAAVFTAFAACSLVAAQGAQATLLDEGSGAATARIAPAPAQPLIPLAQPRPAEQAAAPGGPATTTPLAISQPRNASTGLSMVGSVSAHWGPSGVRMQVQSIRNTRSSGTSGTLRIVLWATTSVPIFGETISAWTMGTFTIGTLQAGFEYTNVDSGLVSFTPPPAGCYYVTLALEEYNGSTFPYDDLATFTTGGTPDGSGHSLFSFGGANCAPTVGCTRDATTACLLSGRFRVTVTYTSNSTGGDAQVMNFGSDRAENDQSVFLWFFSATNFEMGLKILDACGLNNHFWVFISGLTDQGWTVHILDTQTQATATYSNALSHLTQTTADTAAMNCP